MQRSNRIELGLSCKQTEDKGMTNAQSNNLSTIIVIKRVPGDLAKGGQENQAEGLGGMSKQDARSPLGAQRRMGSLEEVPGLRRSKSNQTHKCSNHSQNR